MTSFCDLETFYHGQPKKKADYAYSISLFEEIVGKGIEDYIQNTDDNQFLKDMRKYAELLKTSFVKRHGKVMPGQKLTQSTIRTRLAAVRSYAKENGILIGKKHFAALFDTDEKTGKPIDDTLLDKAFSIEEARNVYHHLTPQMKPLFQVLLSSGMRINEALKVRLKNVDLTKDPARIYIPKEDTKTNTARTVFISSEAKILLQDQWIPGLDGYYRSARLKSGFEIKGSKKERNVQREELKKNLPKNDRLFPMTEANFRHALMRACKKAGLNQGIRYEHHVHSIRKSTRTLLGAQKYHDLGEYQLGHATGMDTHYVRLSVEQAAPIYREAERYLTLGDTLKRIETARDTKVADLEARIKENEQVQAEMMALIRELKKP